MLFNSHIFLLIFLPLVVCTFYFFPKYNKSYKIISLIIFSFIFYGVWNPKYILFLTTSICINFFISKCLIIQNKLRFETLILGLIFNLGLIFYFKYSNFFLLEFASLFHLEYQIINIILPLGISFFTFQQISYLVDQYRYKKYNYRFCDYALYVSFFPQLIAGPIVKHDKFIPQLRESKPSSIQFNISLGVTFLTCGLAKKVLIADFLSNYSQKAFNPNNVDNLDFIASWVGAIAYTFQIYFDFSGYSDMAIGLGLLLGFKLPVNFNSPYKATSIIDFWRRWHITLSQFLRDYLYIPMGGNKASRVKTMTNLIITMFLGGLWHGAGWTFIVWGLMQGLFLSLNHLWKKFLPKVIAKPKGCTKFICWPITFLAIIFSWVVFRSESIDHALVYIKQMIGLNGILFPARWAEIIDISKNYEKYFSSLVDFNKNHIIAFILLLVFVVKMPNTQKILNYNENDETKLNTNSFFKLNMVYGFIFGIILSICIINITTESEFLYFQF